MPAISDQALVVTFSQFTVELADRQAQSDQGHDERGYARAAGTTRYAGAARSPGTARTVDPSADPLGCHRS
jgi:hypothetical protein